MDRNSNCRCGSNLKAKHCCFPTKPPVVANVPLFGKSVPIPAPTPQFEPGIEVPQGVKEYVKAWISSITITQTLNKGDGPGILPKNQVNAQIARILGYGLNQFHLGTVRMEHTLISPLHSVKYHQQQCMYRLHLLNTRNNVKPHSKTRSRRTEIMNTEFVAWEDVALRSEFEAFVSRIGAALDAFSKYVCVCIGKNPKKYGTHYSLLNHLKEHNEKSVTFVSLRRLYLDNQPWSDEVVGELRHIVMHHGMLNTLQPGRDMSPESPFVSPSRNGQKIDVLCVRHWINLMNFIASGRRILIENGLTTDALD